MRIHRVFFNLKKIRAAVCGMSINLNVVLFLSVIVFAPFKYCERSDLCVLIIHEHFFVLSRVLLKRLFVVEWCDFKPESKYLWSVAV